jgi:micrococcal nuclease
LIGFLGNFITFTGNRGDSLQAGRHIIVLASLCLLFHCQPASAQQISTLEGLVVGVAEGDRITVNSFGTEISVRLYGVAAPQLAKIDKFTGLYNAGQPYADDAFRALSLKVLHQQVKVEIRKTLVFKNGEPKQIAIAIVFLDGRNINLEMLSDGWGWAYRKFLGKEDLPHYLAAEKQAKTTKSGLWLQHTPQAPWDFKPVLRIKSPHH